MVILAASAAEAGRGWSGIWGIVAGLVGIFLVWRVDKGVRNRRGEGTPPSPADESAPLPRETRRSRPSRLTSHADETRPRVERIGEAGVVSYEPVRPYRPPVAGGDGDDFLAGTVFDDEYVDDDEVPDDDEFEVGQESREEYAVRCFAGGVKKAAIVAALQEHYGLSRAQAYRVAGDAEAVAHKRAA